jgi:hypothetical protein
MGIKDKFGTGWISRGGSSEDSRASRAAGSGDREEFRGRSDAEAKSSAGSAFKMSGTNPVFLMLGKQMIRFLNDTAGTDRLDNLAEKMKLEPGELQESTEWLASNYYIRVIPDKFGNHEIRLTERAKELS